MKVPFESDDDTETGIVYLWLGSKANPDDVKLAEEIADEMFNSVSTSVALTGYTSLLNVKICMHTYKFILFLILCYRT